MRLYIKRTVPLIYPLGLNKGPVIYTILTMEIRDCERCGNEIPAAAASCRFCGAPQQGRPGRRRGPREPVYTVNIESGLPPVEEGLERLKTGLLLARHNGAKIVRVIHGYGSGGTGGKLREACRAFLRQAKAARQIKDFVPGEEYGGSGGSGQGLIKRCAALRHSERSDCGNPGITLVEL